MDKAHELDADKGFEEVPDDNDFEDTGKKSELLRETGAYQLVCKLAVNQVDVFDDDFASTDDEAEDPDTQGIQQDQALRREERGQKQAQKNRNYHDPLAYLKKGPKQVVSASTPVKSALKRAHGDGDENEKKKRRVSVVIPGEEGQEDGNSPMEIDGEEEGGVNGLDDQNGDDAGPSVGFTLEGETKRFLKGRKTYEGEAKRKAMRNSTLKGRQEVDGRIQESAAQRVSNYPFIAAFAICVCLAN